MQVGGEPEQDTPSSLFDDEWKEYGGEDPFDGLEPIADFNARYDCKDHNLSDAQPLSTFSTSNSAIKSSPEQIHSSEAESSPSPSVDGISQIDSPDILDHFASPRSMPTPSDHYPGLDQDMKPQHAAFGVLGGVLGYDLISKSLEPGLPPYYHQSIEAWGNFVPQREQLFQPLPNYHRFPRRSVSEPPTGPFPIHPDYLQCPQPPFSHSSGIPHTLGQQSVVPSAPPQELVRLKPTPRSRQQIIHQTQPVLKRDVRKTRPKRHALKRARPPTSMPSSPVPSQHSYDFDEPLVMHDDQPMSPQMSPLQFVSTRICTPTPSPERVRRAMPSEANASVKYPLEESKNSLSITMSVEDLQAMITEAVSKAVKDLRSEKGAAAVE